MDGHALWSTHNELAVVVNAKLGNVVKMEKKYKLIDYGVATVLFTYTQYFTDSAEMNVQLNYMQLQ